MRITGPAGSGRTTLARQIAVELDKAGFEVQSIFATPSLRTVPFAGILQMGPDLQPRPSGVVGFASLLAERTSRPGDHALVVDNLECLDPESLSVLDSVLLRTHVPLITTTANSPLRPGTPDPLALRASATVPIAALRYEQVTLLAAQILGGPADADLIARIHTKSGGNLRLAVRIIETGMLSRRIVLREDRWHMSGETLMNEHLKSTVETYLDGLGNDELRALTSMALKGDSPVDTLVESLGVEFLDGLEQRGLVVALPGPDGGPLVSVFPPVLEDYLRDHARATRRILSSGSGGDPPVVGVGILTQNRVRKSALEELRAELAGNHTASARRFHRTLEALEQLHYQRWAAHPSLPNAVAFLKVCWGAPTDRDRVADIFSLTSLQGGDPDDALFFAITQALWTALEAEDLDHATKIMSDLARTVPERAVEARAWTLFLQASYSGMPADLDSLLDGLTGADPAAGVVPLVKGILELYRFNPDRALAAIESVPESGILPRFEPLIRGLALFASGRVDDALSYALERRKDALQRVDQLSLVTSTYVATLALLYRGLFDEAEYLMGWAFALRRPGFLVGSLYNAMLRLSSLRDNAGLRPLAERAAEGIPEVGPLPATGRGAYDLAARPPHTADDFDTAAVQILDTALDHGYILEAVQSGLFLLCLLPGPKILARLREKLGACANAAHSQLLAVAQAALDADIRRLEQLLAGYAPDGDAYQISMLLRGASSRFRSAGDYSTAAAIGRAANTLTPRIPSEGTYIVFEPGARKAGPLTEREKEVALLASAFGNQDIAAQLKLSVRTVESHISNALRKTGAISREELTEITRNLHT
ncbi:LuxR C-terminal-related transcriptional regulator [Sinomonas sp. ASV322]|uniref:LuxR C-terminal-related transcriptional regulator n=1 Tax=Sinomonas sp. ASV322 TaxID=3041920 RepID=UPI0027DE5026|nr:LuxR C-terminal-related transcriptional regulator [Sinomonas sp. ASV322]MDQ4503864.1 LuxR C-terminal-related transcriptional regulator [Sinomonas sp. ASV322]